MRNMRCETFYLFLEESGSSLPFVSCIRIPCSNFKLLPTFSPQFHQILVGFCLRPATIPNQSEYEKCGSKDEKSPDTKPASIRDIMCYFFLILICYLVYQEFLEHVLTLKHLWLLTFFQHFFKFPCWVFVFAQQTSQFHFGWGYWLSICWNAFATQGARNSECKTYYGGMKEIDRVEAEERRREEQLRSRANSTCSRMSFFLHLSTLDEYITKNHL